MKLFSLILATLCLTALPVTSNTNNVLEHSKHNAVENEVTYEASNFTKLPDDWKLYEKCDTANTTTSYAKGELIILNRNTTSAGLYYGSVYYVDYGTKWQDFTFEVTLKMTEPADGNRWCGIGYHTQEVAGSMAGYLMNYRSNGDSAFSAFNSSQSFFDGDRVNKQGVKLSDDNYHTLKVTMKGDIATHYIDDKEIVSWDVNERNEHLGGSKLEYGNFALFVNRSKVYIQKVTIKGTVATVEETIADERIVNTYRPSLEDERRNFPTVVTELKNKDELDEYIDGDVRPSNTILHVNDDLDVIDKNGQLIHDLRYIIDRELYSLVIPIVYIENEKQAQKFMDFCREKLVIDMAVMSKDLSLIKMIKDKYSVIRGIYHLNSLPEDGNLSNIVFDANKNYVGVVVLDEEIATREVVDYIQARCKTIWIKQSNETKMALYNSINTGCYGIIVDDYANLYNLYKDYKKTSLTRLPYNVGHRGFPGIYNENSVYGIQKAIEFGATHIETDVYLTTDGDLAVMHDDDISRTTNGAGKVESFTMAQLKQFKLDVREPHEPIPSLRDVAVPIIEGGAILVLEVKSSKVAIVEVIKAQLEELGLMDRTVVISFNTGILAKFKSTLPEIPTSNLNEARTNSFASVLYWMGTFNTGIATHYTHISSADNMYYLRDRGIMGWYWTYESASSISSYIPAGITFMTNNACNYFDGSIKQITGKEITLDAGETIDLDFTFECDTLAYGGETDIVDASVFAFEEHNDHYEVICTIDTLIGPDQKVTLYTPIFKVYKNAADVVPPGPGGDTSVPGGTTPDTGTTTIPETSIPSSNPGDVTPPNTDNTALIVGLSVAGGVIVLAAAGLVVYLKVFKKKNKK